MIEDNRTAAAAAATTQRKTKHNVEANTADTREATASLNVCMQVCIAYHLNGLQSNGKREHVKGGRSVNKRQESKVVREA